MGISGGRVGLFSHPECPIQSQINPSWTITDAAKKKGKYRSKFDLCRRDSAAVSVPVAISSEIKGFFFVLAMVIRTGPYNESEERS
jgi:hypothetical protein